MKQTFRTTLLALSFTTILFSCEKEMSIPEDEKTTSGKYENGFFIITEGSYGQTAGTINFYRYDADTVSTYAYEKENPGKITSNTNKTSTLQFANIIGNKLYLLSKINGPIIKLDLKTLKEEARYVQDGSNWRGILQVNGDNGLVAANDGVYKIDLKSLELQNKITNVAAVNTIELLKRDNTIFILQQNGTKIISASNYSQLKTYAGITFGYAQTPNGKVWGSTGRRLVSFDANLDTAGVPLTVSVASFSNDSPTRLTASTRENAVFYTSGKNIYKYVDGQPSSVAQPFISIADAPFMIYGVARYDKNKDYLVVNGIQGYGAASGVNFLFIYNASNGQLVKKIKYGNDGTVVDFTKIYFPALTIFQ